jgi:DNA polymerase III gamma/tau subunit
MSYKQSIIIKLENNLNPLNQVLTWFNQVTQNNLSLDSIVNQPHIALINQEGESIGIDVIRELKQQLAYGTYQANQTRYVIFLNAHLTTVSAQNALLKTLEEPPVNSQIILVTHMVEKLLPTIRSRCQIIRVEAEDQKVDRNKESEITTLYEAVIQGNMGARISLASSYKEREDALVLCNQLLRYLHNQLRNPNSKLTLKQITHNSQEVLKTIDYLEANVNVLLALEGCFIKFL